MKPCVLYGLRLTKATVPIIREDKARWAEALETPRAVGTGTKEAEVGLLQALVDVWRGRDIAERGVSRTLAGAGQPRLSRGTDWEQEPPGLSMSQSTRGQYEGNFLEGIFRVGIMIRKSPSLEIKSV